MTMIAFNIKTQFKVTVNPFTCIKDYEFVKGPAQPLSNDTLCVP